jgi:hypothetical protein
LNTLSDTPEKMYQSMAQSILDGDFEVAKEFVRQSMIEGYDPQQVIILGYMI